MVELDDEIFDWIDAVCEQDNLPDSSGPRNNSWSCSVGHCRYSDNDKLDTFFVCQVNEEAGLIDYMGIEEDQIMETLSVSEPDIFEWGIRFDYVSECLLTESQNDWIVERMERNRIYRECGGNE